MITCTHCQQQIAQKQAHYRTCTEYKKKIYEWNLLLTKEFLHNQYIISQKSTEEIHKEFKIEKKGFVLKKLQEFSIQKRTSKERAQNSRRQILTKETCIKRYGYDHHLSSPEVILKREISNEQKYGKGIINVFQAQKIKETSKQTFLKKYGAECASQVPEMKNKVMNTCLLRYGVDNPWKSPSIIRTMMAKKAENGHLGRQYSKCSQRFFWKLHSLLTEDLQKDAYFAELNKEFGKMSHDGSYKFYDFVLPSIKFCLEYNGTYFHADPKRYDSDWFNKKIKLTAKEIWENDIRKLDLIKQSGFYVEVMWQSDSEDEALQRILLQIQLLSNSIK